MIKKFLFILTGVCCFLVFTASAQTTFSNNAGITINDGAAASPYPSTIAVSGLGTSITKVTVTLTGFNHQFEDDAGFLLVGPTGVKVRLMTDCGGTNTPPGRSVNLTFDDSAASAPTCNALLVNGTYKPTAGGASTTGSSPHPANFPAPAPANPYSLLLSDFNGTDPNGTWNLYVDDDTVDGPGTLSGWSITITASVTTAAMVSVSGRAMTSGGRGIKNARISVMGSAGQTQTAMTNPFGYYRFQNLPAGIYIIAIESKGYTFSNPNQVLNLLEDTPDLNFVADN